MILLGSLLLILGIVITYFWSDTNNPYVASPMSVKCCDLTVPDSIIPKFSEVTIDFEHQFDDKDNGFPMCYVSFAIFFSLVVLKIVHLKIRYNSEK